MILEWFRGIDSRSKEMILMFAHLCSLEFDETLSTRMNNWNSNVLSNLSTLIKGIGVFN